jgi:hypothetical protein
LWVISRGQRLTLLLLLRAAFLLRSLRGRLLLLLLLLSGSWLLHVCIMLFDPRAACKQSVSNTGAGGAQVMQG